MLDLTSLTDHDSLPGTRHGTLHRVWLHYTTDDPRQLLGPQSPLSFGHVHVWHVHVWYMPSSLGPSRRRVNTWAITTMHGQEGCLSV
jgi:hypothetical protein